MSHKKAIALTCFVAFLWSLAGFNVKMIHWSAYAIAGGRSLIAVLLLSPLFLGRRMEINRYVMGGALCYAAFNYCFITRFVHCLQISLELRVGNLFAPEVIQRAAIHEALPY